MAAGVALPQALQLISGVPLAKVGSVFAEKLSITKRLDGGPGLGGLMAKVLQDGNLSSVMQNPMAALTQGLQAQIGTLAGQLSNVVGAGGLVSALTGVGGLSNALGVLQAAGDNLAGLTNGASGFFAMLGHSATADLAGGGLPSGASMAAVTAPLASGDLLNGMSTTLPQVVNQVIAGTMTPDAATAWVQTQVGLLGGIVSGSAGALAYGAQMHPMIATVSSVAGALAVPPSFDAAGNRQNGAASGFQAVLGSLVRLGPAATMAASLAAQTAHTKHDPVDVAAMTSLGDD